MLPTTEATLRGLLSLDNTIPAELISEAIGILKAGKPTEPEMDKAVDAETAAKMLGVSERSITNYANRGLIRRIGGGVTKTRARYSVNSIRNYINGATSAA